MSELSYLEKLLNGVDVQWKTIGEVTLRTSNIKWREATRSYRYVDLTSVDIETKKITETTEVTANNAPSRAQKLIEENDVIFATTRPAQQRFCLINGEYSDEVASTGFCVLRAKQDEVLPKWILHWISTSYFKNHVEENQSGSAYPAISDAKVKECSIPVPCPENPEKSLAIQSEIVRILDKFTALKAELTAELTAELSMRKKQYNHYRDLLLSFEEGEVEWKTLGEMGTLIRGKRFVKADIIPKGVPCIHYGEMYTHYSIWANRAKSYISVELASKLRKASCGDVVFVSAGETIADIGRGTAWLGDEDVVIHDACFFYKSSLNPKYVAYFSRTNFFHDQIKKSISSGKISAINAKGFEKVIIPVPSPEEQARIVAFLDKFDTLTSSITEGLPREIELRQKQYEYYRDLLFSFPKPETASN